MSPPRLLFLGTEGFPPTVYDAQVGDLLAVLARAGLAFEALNFDPLFPLTFATRAGRARVARLRAALPAGLRVLPYLPYEDRLGAPWAGALLRLALGRRRPTVVHARGLWAAFLAARLARRRPWLQVVYDVRGDYEAEHVFHRTGRGDPAGARVPGLARIRRAEAAACGGAARLLCVSAALRDALEARHPGVAARALVIPCGHDPDKFRLDPAARARWRAALGLEGRWVLVYAGSLVPYQLPERVVRAGALACAARPDAHLLLLTPQVEQGERLLRAAGLGPERATCRAAAHGDVPGLLNACDAALLLRRRDPVNRAASPTKVAEYLACGLPLVVSDGIGDTSALVRDRALGAVLADPDDDLELARALGAVAAGAPERERIAAVARDRLARPAFVPEYLALYRGLASRAGAT